jgi:hypothetical protein
MFSVLSTLIAGSASDARISANVPQLMASAATHTRKRARARSHCATANTASTPPTATG